MSIPKKRLVTIRLSELPNLSFDREVPEDGPVSAVLHMDAGGEAFVRILGLRGEPEGRDYPADMPKLVHHLLGKTWANKRMAEQVEAILSSLKD